MNNFPPHSRLALPSRPLSDKQFAYVPADKSDLRETFARVLREIKRHQVPCEITGEKQ